VTGAASSFVSWPECPLKSLVDDRGITYGIVQPGQPQVDGVPILRVNNFRSGGLQLDDVMRVAPEVAARFKRSTLRGGEVLITLVGSTGQVAVASPELSGWNVARAVGVVPVRDRDLARWVAWCLQTPSARAFLDSRLNTTVQSTLNLRDLASLSIPMPPAAERAAIASVIGALEDKIDSNRRLAALLEDGAATMFRARFVDFVGVEEFEESEIGRVPRGWRVGSVYDVAEVTYGRPFSSNLFSATEGTPLVRIRDLPASEPSVLTSEIRPDARLVRRGDIVVGMDGEFRAYAWAGPDAWLNQRVCAFDPRDGVSRAFLLEGIKGPLAFFEATKGGTTVIHLGKRDIDTFVTVVPPPALMRAFAATADPMLRLAVELRWENRIVASVRNAILPKLISGQIRVSDTADLAEVIEPAAEGIAALS
jgi:type I restriction enzyme S subunit